ncbi:MAG: hypothetical protein HON76_06335 [Candidatus Scalindua sp.]|nr:hypothetical protein [Candidatus Scalindua sp.]MBT5307521.1 hypothetical protein [Candidatus Scalindua sp.]MBT6047658.1 hypothetical protein [Candidatus Scalindua sp.]MBT6228323.1 hypothetical protein [Candidatus Scalindua sp.]MBT6562128.1 hypothetical protein [Candidatus Scalindua sp.]
MEDKLRFRLNPSLKLMDQVREVLRYHHYAYRTETSYCQWILRYLRFFGSKTHPKDLCSQHVERFLSNLTTQGKVSALFAQLYFSSPILFTDLLSISIRIWSIAILFSFSNRSF